MTEQDQTGCVITSRGPLMQLGAGRVFYPFDPRPEEVNIKDIAQSLSRIIRFGGHSDLPINVAHHSLNCSYLAWRNYEDVDMQRYMLLHDSAEAYIGDMIRPLKITMPDFQIMEARIFDTIIEALDIKHVDMKRVKHYDNVACAWEKRDLFKSAMKWTGMPDIDSLGLRAIPQLSSEASRTAFLSVNRGLIDDKSPDECE